MTRYCRSHESTAEKPIRRAQRDAHHGKRAGGAIDDHLVDHRLARQRQRERRQVQGERRRQHVPHGAAVARELGKRGGIRTPGVAAVAAVRRSRRLRTAGADRGGRALVAANPPPRLHRRARASREQTTARRGRRAQVVQQRDPDRARAPPSHLRPPPRGCASSRRTAPSTARAHRHVPAGRAPRSPLAQAPRQASRACAGGGASARRPPRCRTRAGGGCTGCRSPTARRPARAATSRSGAVPSSVASASGRNVTTRRSAARARRRATPSAAARADTRPPCVRRADLRRHLHARGKRHRPCRRGTPGVGSAMGAR